MTELDRVLHAEISHPHAADGLTAHIDGLIESHRTQALLSTTSPAAAVGELARRNEGIEEAIRALAAAIEDLAAAQR